MEYILNIAEFIGIISFTISGFLVASYKNLDLLGIFIASFLTALGGGVIRDIIAKRDIIAFNNDFLVITILITFLIAIIFKINRFEHILKSNLFLLFDNVGLISFAISGAIVAINSSFNFFGVALLALITAVGGGVLRDILINKIPFILTQDIYGVIAILIGISIYFLEQLMLLNYITIFIVFIVGFLLRAFAIKYKWQLPKI